MSLSKKQQNYIKEKHKSYSAAKISKDLNLDVKEVEGYINKIKKKPPFYFYIILLSVPLVFLGTLEACLRIFDYGYENIQWGEAVEGKLTLNNDIVKRYFHSVKNTPRSIADVFDKEKKENSFRIFVLGGSSAAGYPYMPVGSFSRYIQRRLDLFYPESKNEVVNISLTAVNSYTLRDLFDGVVEQKPDIILIYAGHNEYYGALGIGSMESLGISRSIVNFTLKLERFKTFVLLRNIMKSIVKLAATDKGKPSGTLMSRMAKEKYIAFNSEIYNKGLEQFEGNLTDILNVAKRNNVRIILGNLVSNLKDQRPFISLKENELPEANIIYSKALIKYNNNQFKDADSLLRLSKDLDALRFRAPEKINSIIKQLGREFNIPVANIDSAFVAESPNGIIGDNLMTDHLHPNLEGYFLIGKTFFEEIEKHGYLPKRANDHNNPKEDSLTREKFYISSLDSVIAEYKIALLKNDWPYINKAKKKKKDEVLSPKNFIDSTAAKFASAEITWEDGYIDVINYFLERKEYIKVEKYMDILISQYPVISEYYAKASEAFLTLKKYDVAEKYLKAFYNLENNVYNSKWLGNISLFNNKHKKAIEYLQESYSLDSTDAQVCYNLAGAYSLNSEYNKAYDMVNKCLEINPNYSGADGLRKQLIPLLNN